MSRNDIFKDLLAQWGATDDRYAPEEGLQTSLREVESSNLAAVGYDYVNEVLEVAFLDGSVYRYFDVPIEVANGLMDAPSHGSYFYWNIRESYSFERIIG